jgi:proteasome lid subunit RPN8/RPN11
MIKKRTEKQPQKQQNQETPPDDWLDNEECVRPKQPTLRFSPTAWAKLLYFRDKSENEVGGFAVTEPDDLLSVTEVLTVKQEVSWVSVKFDDEAVGQFFDEQVDLGRKPEQFARLWLHTHPSDCPNPSATDEATFKRVFGGCQWAVMCVVAQDGSVYARLSFNIGPGGQVLIPVEVDYSQPFAGSDHEGWDKEYETNVRACHCGRTVDEPKTNLDGSELPCDFLEEFESLDPAQRQILLDELADRPDLWDESEVIFL